MAKIPARLNDVVSSSTHGNGSIISTSTTTTFQGQPVACAGDHVMFSDGTTATIIEGNACVEVNNKRIALINDTTQNDGIINSGATGIQVDEGDPFVFIGNNVEIGPNVIFSKTPMEFYDQYFQLISASTGQALPHIPYRIHTPQEL
ncbi:MAG TPA: PAAR domain-containing protein [Gammaproteobacteria bacterium]|nr:PAAR domain-containing protein [Gammaproteobacteria bacterium]